MPELLHRHGCSVLHHGGQGRAPRIRRRRSITMSNAPISTQRPTDKTNWIDVVGLGNICLDIRVPVKALPVRVPGWRQKFISQFGKNRKQSEGSLWEAGGIANTLFMTHRLGLSSSALGYLANDIYGSFCKQCLQEEDVAFHSAFTKLPFPLVHDGAVAHGHPFLIKTAVCFVVVDSNQDHVFVSQFEVTPGPVFCHRSALTPEGLDCIRHAKALVMNGYAFQECGQDLLRFVFEEALRAKTTTFFDPGPHGVSLVTGSPEEKATLLHTLQSSNVIFATCEEAEKLTGESDPITAGHALLKTTDSITKWVIIKLGAKGSLFFRRGYRDVIHTKGFKVPVLDTVGCGDSFLAAVIHGYLETNNGEDSSGILELANAVGAITAMGRGAGRNVAKLSDVRSLLLEERILSHGHDRYAIDAALGLLNSSQETSPLVKNASS